MIACYGGRDVPSRKAPEQLRTRLSTVGVTPEVHIFPEAGHAFLTDGHHPIASALTWPLMHVQYNPQAAEAGWAKIEAFFDRELRGLREASAEACGVIHRRPWRPPCTVDTRAPS